MKKKLEQRLQALKDELASGQTVMAELDKKQTDLQHTMLRISGAIQVLEELLQESAGQDADEVPVAVRAVTPAV